MQNVQKTALFAVAAQALAATAALAQQGGNLQTNEAVPSLMFFTLGIVLLVAIGAFVYFLRKRSNREAAERALGVDEQAGRHPRR